MLLILNKRPRCAESSRTIPAGMILQCISLMEFENRSRKDDGAASPKMQTGEIVSQRTVLEDFAAVKKSREVVASYLLRRR
jgi:hypothetical protein